MNLLLNSGFTGNYETEDMDADKQLDADTELYSKALLNWSGMATVQEDAGATSGRSATIGSLSQSVTLIPNEVYVISYRAKGTSLAVSCGDYSVSQSVTDEYLRYTHKFTYTGTGVFLISGTATICDLQLERGTIATDWKPSILDNDKTNAKFQAIQYLSDAMKNGSVDILGGLILANIIQLGNYKDGVLQKITAGISGIYNDDDDVYTWGGGSLEKAIYTVMKYKDNPQYEPTEEELLNMAKAVITHGGRAIFNDVIVRGYIHALGGFFRGKVETAVDGQRIVIDPSENSIQMFDANNKLIYDLSFNTFDDGKTIVPKMMVRGYSGDENVVRTAYGANGFSGYYNNMNFAMGANGLSFSYIKSDGLIQDIVLGIRPNGIAMVRIEGLPTEDKVDALDQLYQDANGFIKIKKI